MNFARPRVPNQRIKKLGGVGQLKTTPCSRAAGKFSRHEHFGLVSLEPTPVTAVSLYNQIKGASGAGAKMGFSTVMQNTEVSNVYATPPSIQRPEGR